MARRQMWARLRTHLKPIAVLFAGSGTTAIVPLISAPITARLYEPEAFGRLAMVMTVANLAALPYVAGFSRSLLLAPSSLNADQQFRDLASTLSLVACAAIILSTLGSLWAPSWTPILLFASISLFFIAAASIVNSWMVHAKLYRGLTWLRVSQALSTAIISIVLGLLGFVQYGIILGYTLGQVFALLIVLSLVPRFRPKLFPSWRPLAAIVRENPKLFLTSLPAEALNMVTRSLPVIMLSSFSTATVVGLFNMAMRLVELPASFLSSAFSQYFQSIAISRHNQGDRLFAFVLAYTGFLFCVGFPIVFFAFPYLPDLAAWALGERWREAGEFSQFICVFIFLRVVVSPVTFVIFLHKAFLVSLWMDVILFLAVFFGFYVALAVFDDVRAAILIFSAVYSTSYVLSFCLSVYFSGRRGDPQV